MKLLTVLTILLVLFTAAPVMACGGEKECDKDKQAFTVEAQPLCGGDKGDKGDKGDTCDKDKDTQAFAFDIQTLCDGGKKGDKSQEPQLLCGGGKDKDKGDNKS